jgi:hypothetical protein
MVRRDPGVARVLALHHATQRKAVRQFHRHILERVHGDVGAPLFQRHLKLLDKKTLATDLAERAVQDLVAQRGHAQQGDAVATLLQQRLYVFGLPQGQAAFPGGDGDGNGRGTQGRGPVVFAGERRC